MAMSQVMPSEQAQKPSKLASAAKYLGMAESLASIGNKLGSMGNASNLYAAKDKPYTPTTELASPSQRMKAMGQMAGIK